MHSSNDVRGLTEFGKSSYSLKKMSQGPKIPFTINNKMTKQNSYSYKVEQSVNDYNLNLIETELSDEGIGTLII